ncbi:MAG: D-alanyl-D-alanine carboxypeptidase [Bacteroidota bacterium]
MNSYYKLAIVLAVFALCFDLRGQSPTVLERLIEENPVFNQAYSGFCLYDPIAGEYLYEYRADHRFTPASNVKLLTFLLVQEILDTNRVPALWFKDFGHRIDAWATGLPIEMVSEIPFAEAEGKEITIHDAGEVSRYGPGWSYDDYNYGYVYERSCLPAFQNRLQISLDTIGHLQFKPALLTDSVSFTDAADGPLISRQENSNRFVLDTTRKFPIDFERNIALHLDRITQLALWRSAWQDDLQLGRQALPAPSPGLNLLRTHLPDSILIHTLQESDNFWAEQLLLLCAAERQSNLDTESLLHYATDSLWADWENPTEMQWVDGSGLSRYNQLSPRHLVWVLDRLQMLMGMDSLKGYLPANGISGTLESRFRNARPPYIWAKTGSLKNVLALSGVVKTKSGRQLLFSFLHNHTQKSNTTYFREMEKVLEYLYDRY